MILTKMKLDVEKAACDESLYHHQELLTFVVFCCCLNIQVYSYFSFCFDNFSSKEYMISSHRFLSIYNQFFNMLEKTILI